MNPLVGLMVEAVRMMIISFSPQKAAGLVRVTSTKVGAPMAKSPAAAPGNSITIPSSFAKSVALNLQNLIAN